MLAAVVTALFAASFPPPPLYLLLLLLVHSRVMLFSHSTHSAHPWRVDHRSRMFDDFVAFLSKSQEDRAFQWSGGDSGESRL